MAILKKRELADKYLPETVNTEKVGEFSSLLIRLFSGWDPEVIEETSTLAEHLKDNYSGVDDISDDQWSSAILEYQEGNIDYMPCSSCGRITDNLFTEKDNCEKVFCKKCWDQMQVKCFECGTKVDREDAFDFGDGSYCCENCNPYE